MDTAPWQWLIYQSQHKDHDLIKLIHDRGEQRTRPLDSPDSIAAERMAVHAYRSLLEDPTGAVLRTLVCRVWRDGEEERRGYAYGKEWVERRRAA